MAGLRQLIHGVLPTPTIIHESPMTVQRCAIYARYSSREQAGTSTIESQIRECRNYARQHGLTMVEDAVFVDRAETGTTTETRDGFKAMIAAAQRVPQPFQVILVWKYSRFARNKDDSTIFKGLLRRRGIDVVSVSEPVDKHSATGILSEGLIELVDQFYSARLAEEVRRGQTQTTLEGFATGGKAPYGFRRIETADPTGRVNRAGHPVIRVTLEIDPAEAVIVRRIFDSYADGAGYKRIVVALNQEGVRAPRGGSWDVSAVREILRNPAYRGARAYGRIQKVRTDKGTRSKRSKPRDTWVMKENAHPSIISPDLWDRVQRRLAHVAAVYQRNGQQMGTVRGEHSEYLLTGILICAPCGGHFVGRPGAKRRDGTRPYYYGCGYNARRGTSVCRNAVLLPRETVEREVLDVLLQSVLTPSNVGRLLQAVNARLRAQTDLSRPRFQELQEALRRVEREIENFVQAIGRGDFASLEGALKAAEARREVLRREIAEVENTRRGMLQLTPQVLAQHLEGLTEKLRSGVTGRVREAIRASVEKILVGEDGSLTLEVKPEGLLGTETAIGDSDGRGTESVLAERTIQTETGRQWRVIGAG